MNSRFKQRTIAFSSAVWSASTLDLVVECGALGRNVVNRAMMIMTRFTISGYGRPR